MPRTDGAGLVGVLESARDAAAEALARTPSSFRCWPRPGVVDAGGPGTCCLSTPSCTSADGRALPEAPARSRRCDVVIARLARRSARTGRGRIGDDGEDGVEGGLRYEVMYFLHAKRRDDPGVQGRLGRYRGLHRGGGGRRACGTATSTPTTSGPPIEAALDAGRPRNIRVTDLIEQVQEERWVREGALVPPAA